MDRDVPKGARFTWDDEKKIWWTDNKKKAAKLIDLADNDLKDTLAPFVTKGRKKKGNDRFYLVDKYRVTRIDTRPVMRYYPDVETWTAEFADETTVEYGVSDALWMWLSYHGFDTEVERQIHTAEIMAGIDKLRGE